MRFVYGYIISFNGTWNKTTLKGCAGNWKTIILASHSKEDMRLKVQNSIGVNTMKVKLMKAKLKHVCNQKEFIWGVRVSGLILGIG